MTPTDKLKKLLSEATMKEIPGYPGYFATPEGCIFSSTNWRGKPLRELAQQYRKAYPTVRVGLDGRRQKLGVHKAIALTFLDQTPGKDLVCHKDGNPNNNHVDNLYWGSLLDNMRDRTLHGNCTGAINGRNSAWKLKKEYRNEHRKA